MKALEEKILREGTILPGDVLKVGSFLNQQLDTDFMMEMGREIAQQFSDAHVTKVLTIESSGIALAFAAAAHLHVPVVFAKKNRTSNLSQDVYSATVHSYTHNQDYSAIVSRDYLGGSDRILIVDDFLACGNAMNGLMSIAEQASAFVVGVSAAIEKGYQHGGDALRARGIRVYSLAIIEHMEPGTIVYRT